MYLQMTTSVQQGPVLCSNYLSYIANASCVFKGIAYADDTTFSILFGVNDTAHEHNDINTKLDKFMK